MIAVLYDVEISTINEHIKKIFSDSELEVDATIRNFRIVQTEGLRQVNREVKHYSLQMIIAKAFVESEFEKYRVIQDKLFKSDFDKLIEGIKSEE